MPNEKPILMSAPMVRAILAGTKTQTRRIVKPPRPTGAFVCVQGYWHDGPSSWWPLVSSDGESMLDGNGCETPMRSPYGALGDRIWVRETWAKSVRGAIYKANFDLSDGFRGSHIYDESTGEMEPLRWRPSIHMPRWASRITLEITDVRVQRLQEISEEDARAEGFMSAFGPGMRYRAFDSLWNAIHGDGAWDANPWVWTYSFRRLNHAC